MLASLLFSLTLLPTPAHADMTMGRCSFYGNQPSSGTTIGGMQVYHNGTLRQTETRGTQQIYRVDGGDVWVIYRSHDEIAKYVFLGGSVQNCDKNI